MSRYKKCCQKVLSKDRHLIILVLHRPEIPGSIKCLDIWDEKNVSSILFKDENGWIEYQNGTIFFTEDIVQNDIVRV